MDMHGTKVISTTAGVCHAESSSTVLSLGTVFCVMLSFSQLREIFALIMRPSGLQTPSTLTTHHDEALAVPQSLVECDVLWKDTQDLFAINMLCSYLIPLSLAPVGYRTWYLLGSTPCSYRVLWEGLASFFSFFLHFLKLKGLFLI